MPDATAILRENLDRLRRTEPELAERIEQATPAALSWQISRSGELTAMVERDGHTIALASRYDPITEADKLISMVDRTRHAGIVVMGLGVGHHVARLARGLDTTQIMIVFEPDLGLLRAVLEKIDYTAWLAEANVILADAAMDRAGLTSRLERFGGIVTQGTVIVTHPPTRQLHGQEVSNFGRMVADVLAYCRTTVATTLVNMARTVRNLAMNVGHYVAGADTNELYHAAEGHPAVCVGAGPSLAKNVQLLSDPQVRRKVIVISAQTTLKPLLDRGIRPDFVTALDYHEISRRFYEDLPPLPDVTLVAEPKAHQHIFDNFPGPIRVTHSKFLHKLLGPLAKTIIAIPNGATVAHLSFYLAQHLGCDPIILIGQDLGFSDGLYYCPGTAIHQVWEPELNPFNTLEMMEWQRIVRHRGALSRAMDIHGRDIFTDEQMTTYLKQFERDFMRAPQRVIDATEGGVAKDHTVRMTLAEALGQYAVRPTPKIPMPSRGLDPRRLEQTRELLRRRFDEIAELRQLSSRTMLLLRQMIEHQRDRRRFDRLYEQVQKNKRRVEQLDEAFTLINELNSIGAFKRARADRALQHAGGDAFDQQRRQIERDLENLDWLIQSCDEATHTFRDALRRLMAGAGTSVPPETLNASALATSGGGH